VYYSNDDIRIEELPVPAIGPGELLVRVDVSGICGSDVMEWDRVPKAPQVLGHEIAGVVVEVGDGVDRFKKGDHVTAAHHVPCNTCRYCLSGHHTACDTLRTTKFDPGGFAEFVRLPAINVNRGVFPIPDDVSLEEASLTEPLACVLRGQRIARIEPWQSVVVIGSGIAGLLHVQLARALGATRVIATDISDYRLKAALHFGADATIHAGGDVPALLRKANDGRLADLVIVCTGAPVALEQSLELVERGGTVLFFAAAEPDVTLSVPLTRLFYKNDITLTTSYAGSPADYANALELIHSRRVLVKDMITHRLHLEDIQKGFQLVASAGESLKVVIEPQQ
jgi:L-iditol 2-dehydrogenase